MAKRVWSFSPKAPRGFGVVAYLDEGEPSILLQYRVAGQRRTLSLGHRNRKKAEREANDFVSTRIAAAGREPEAAPSAPSENSARGLTLGRLRDLFTTSEYSQTLTDRQQQANRTKLGLWCTYLGDDRTVASLDEEAVIGFCNARRAGRRSLPKARGQQTLKNDFSSLRTAIRWAMRTKNGGSRPILGADPLYGVIVGGEKNPVQPVIDHETYLKLRKAARGLDNGAPLVFLVVAEGTAQRENAIRLLRWQDIDFDQGGIWWEAEVEIEGEAVRADKVGFRDFVPAAPRVLAVLRRWREKNSGSTWVFPSPRGRPYALSYVDKWPRMLYREAGLTKPSRVGWHSFRRKLVTELAASGESLASIQTVTRHRSIASLARYIRMDKEREARRLVGGRRNRV